MPVTEQVPYGKQTTEDLGWQAGVPANKRLAMAIEEYLPRNWFKGPEKLGQRGKTNDVWKIINRMNKNVINMVYSSGLIAMGNYLSNYTKYQPSKQVPNGNNNVSKKPIKSNLTFYPALRHSNMIMSAGSCILSLKQKHFQFLFNFLVINNGKNNWKLKAMGKIIKIC